ncbi:MAG: NAD(+)/NADH kinase [Candidatus Hadarchaeia archaeon]
MKIGIVTRSDSNKFLKVVEKILKKFPREEIILTPDIAEKFDRTGVKIADMDPEAMVTIGGDGTVLYTLQKSPNAPILGINMGGKGFLADVRPDEIEKALDKLRKRELGVKRKKTLAVEVSGEHLANALNEGVIRSKEPSRILPFKLSINGEEAETNMGDGLIVSTPTGSTAYSMAAGGPIIAPDLDAFVITPLSAHRPKTMPLVCPMSSKIEVELLGEGREADVTVDGQVKNVAKKGDLIRFKKSDLEIKFFNWGNKFYEKIKEKL